MAEREVEEGATRHAVRGPRPRGDDGVGGAHHVVGRNLPVDGDDRVHRKATPGTGEVDTDGACPVRLGDELMVPRIVARRLKDLLDSVGPGTRRQGSGVDQLEGDAQETFVARGRGQQTDEVRSIRMAKRSMSPRVRSLAQASMASGVGMSPGGDPGRQPISLPLH
jgi:hypothetical protein